MSRLEELIQELCPDGVEFKRLVSVVNVLYGYPLDSKHFTDDPSFTPLIRIRDVKPGYSETFYKGEVPDGYIIHKGDILVGMDGEFNLARWNSCDAILNQRVCKLSSKDETIVLNGYIHHLLAPKFKEIENSIQGSTVKHLSAKVINNLQIPVPPLPVQEEIVRILDNFTELTTELTTELEARKKQYEYYRDQLLESPRGEVIETTMGNVLTFLNGRAYKQEELLGAGKYPVLRVGNFYTNSSWYYSDLELEESKYCENGDLLYSWAATLGPKIWDGGKCIFHYHIWKILFDEEVIDKQYLYYYLQYDLSQIAKSTTKSTMIHVSMGSMKGRPIRLPHISEQKRIAQLIRRFDVLSSDMKMGLPAEIEARKKQYEFYRDKLLSFKEAGK